MSWAVPTLPIIDVTHASSALGVLLPVFSTGMHFEWDSTTALTETTPFSWLPESTKLQGFEDWYDGEEHYSPAQDPLHISNLEHDLLPELQGTLNNVNIRHILLVKLESTRKDVFPFKRDGFIWEKLAQTFREGMLPEHILERLGTLTPTANFLTGDYDDGFRHSEKSPRGGISFDNAFTTASYTRKSFTGTLCGITPLVADFNVEFENHIYQPCLPQIFNAFNKITAKNDTDYRTFPWKTYMMQSITDSFDRAHEQLPEMGYAEENIITKEYLKGDSPKFGHVDLPDINYYGMAEIAIEDYIRDAFASAKRDNERVLLTHITSTTHHPFELPENEKYVALSEDSDLDDLSHYLNAVGYVDGWMGKILDILEEQEVANETLVVAVGDHGLSIAENHGVTAYLNANVANFHVPLVLSHPELPAIRSDAAVQSLQILPTILDLLRETDSLSSEAFQAAADLLGIYEGQSLIRPILVESNETGQPDWQFTVMNPGKATLSVRSAREPEWRVVVPIVEDMEWRFTNLEESPNETEEIVIFGFIAFLDAIQDRHGRDAAEWAETAAFMARWWVDENRRRYRSKD
ncbi:sulfatase domain-containing protein [Cordyceps javanica]|uniref:Sulfatase domain-containing protein n=1 Tax=Cordyceps javanica TaxID=43265 RepID=A0A545UWL3_9HYPO|nr:sulfatase domain-containing protein [Cordyceps javanica]TQW04629.1 sulfatase domain protein [Cordyceps javanica]